MNDIEIYIREPDPAAVEAWLSTQFEEIHLAALPNGKGYKGTAEKDGRRIPVRLFLNAVGKYASLLFESSDAPWESDLDCAREAWKMLGQETRCATGEWQENADEEEDLWWVINDKGENQIRWQG